MMDLETRIKEICDRPDGVDLVGIAPIDRFDALPGEKRPTAFLPRARSVIVIGSQLFQVLTEKLTAFRKIGEISFRDLYDAHKETVDRDLKQTGYRLARFLTNQGCPSINLGQDLTDNRTVSAVFSFMYAAVQAGLGVIGKNGLLITPDFGPRLALTAILTEAPLAGSPLLTEDVCGDCSICIKVCPSGALQEPARPGQVSYDRFRCSAFYTANQGCGLCLAKCPR